MLRGVRLAAIRHFNPAIVMKTMTCLLAVSSLLVATSSAAPFLSISDNAEVFLTGTLGVRVDDNIALTPEATSDTIFDISPGAQLVFGRESTVQGTWSVVHSFANYLDHDELNTNLFSTAFNAGYDDGKAKGSFNASFNEINQNTVDVQTDDGSLIRRDVFAIGTQGEVDVSEKSSVSIGLQYQGTEYKRYAFSDTKVATLPLGYYYEITPKVDLSVNYRYRESWLQHGYDSKDHFFGVGARGVFTPKLRGQFSVGLTQRNFREHKGLPDMDDKSLFGIDSSLSYEASPKTTLQFGVSNDFDTNSQGQQQKNFAVRISALASISDEWSVTGGISYRAINYYSRTDDYVEGQVGATYILNENVQVTAAIALRSNESDLASSDFDNSVVSLAAALRF